eukprot:SAG31_NODE_126_length_23665_cov_6.178987_15_plen_474_part_00
MDAFDTDPSADVTNVVALKIMETEQLSAVAPETIRQMSLPEFGQMLLGFRASAVDRQLLTESLAGQRMTSRGQQYNVTKLDFALQSYGANFTVPAMMKSKTGAVRFDAGPFEKAEMVEAGYRRTLQFVTSDVWAGWGNAADGAADASSQEQVTELGCGQTHALTCAPRAADKSCFDNKGNLGGECGWITEMKAKAKAEAAPPSSFASIIRWAMMHRQTVASVIVLLFIGFGTLLERCLRGLSRYSLRYLDANRTECCQHCLRGWDANATLASDRRHLTETDQRNALKSRGVAPTTGWRAIADAMRPGFNVPHNSSMRRGPADGTRSRKKATTGPRIRSRTPSSSPVREQEAQNPRTELARQLEFTIAVETISNFAVKSITLFLRVLWVTPVYILLFWMLFSSPSSWPFALLTVGLLLRQFGAPSLAQVLLIGANDAGRHVLLKYNGVVTAVILIAFSLGYQLYIFTMSLSDSE